MRTGFYHPEGVTLSDTFIHLGSLLSEVFLESITIFESVQLLCNTFNQMSKQGLIEIGGDAHL